MFLFATPTMVPITEINTNMRVQTTSCVVASRRLLGCFSVGGFTSLFVTLREVTDSALCVVAYDKETQPWVHRLPFFAGSFAGALRTWYMTSCSFRTLLRNRPWVRYGKEVSQAGLR